MRNATITALCLILLTGCFGDKKGEEIPKATPASTIETASVTPPEGLDEFRLAILGAELELVIHAGMKSDQTPYIYLFPAGEYTSKMQYLEVFQYCDRAPDAFFLTGINCQEADPLFPGVGKIKIVQFLPMLRPFINGYSVDALAISKIGDRIRPIAMVNDRVIEFEYELDLPIGLKERLQNRDATLAQYRFPLNDVGVQSIDDAIGDYDIGNYPDDIENCEEPAGSDLPDEN